ncbi:hypothetical protein [Neobacillus vireti]|uniref:Spore coat protein b n=1 Tax=Neobacillus vireti LMG 21834 TaxID=1131730 RepID=A0AB94IH57_9BACI|nr:hypothetical protein [Neobacillus vireti]ETI66450.1 spore coat protein b [Neobacillus vireti LMG 21834]KLT15877.1 hypothetical protein AA980_22020 [Neobacillus vireti]
MGLDKFSAALDLLKGFNVDLYVGEDVFKGTLIGVETDHVVLETENKYIFYYNIDKIQAITKNTRLFQTEETTAEFQKTQTLTELLNSFQHSWVSILSVNKQRFNGVLSDIDSDFATLINGEERILIKLSHVSNILKGDLLEEKPVKPQTPKPSAQKNNKTKEEGTASSEKSENKNETKYTSIMKDASNTSVKKTKAKNHEEQPERQQAAAAITEINGIIEPNNSMVWSQPIKSETPEALSNVEVPEMNRTINTQKADEVNSPLANIETTKATNDSRRKEEKFETPKMNKQNLNESLKEMKPVKETTTASLLPETKKEVKPAKVQETKNVSKPVVSEKAVANKTENKAKEASTNKKNTKTEVTSASKKDTKAVVTKAPKKDSRTEMTSANKRDPWAEMTNSNKRDPWTDMTSANKKDTWTEGVQKQQESKSFRFAGEPVSRENSRAAFPFAGWPNRSKRTFKF